MPRCPSLLSMAHSRPAGTGYNIFFLGLFWVFLWLLWVGSYSQRRSSFLTEADEGFFSNWIVSLHLLLDHHFSQSLLLQSLATCFPAHIGASEADCRCPIHTVCSQVIGMPKKQDASNLFLTSLAFLFQYFTLPGCRVGIESTEPASGLAKSWWEHTQSSYEGVNTYACSAELKYVMSNKL